MDGIFQRWQWRRTFPVRLSLLSPLPIPSAPARMRDAVACRRIRQIHGEEVPPDGRGGPHSQSAEAAADRKRAAEAQQGHQRPDPRERAAADSPTSLPQREEQAGIQVATRPPSRLYRQASLCLPGSFYSYISLLDIYTGTLIEQNNKHI